MKEYIVSLTVGEIVGWCASIIAFITLVIEFNKKINLHPLSACLNWIGDKTNKGINDKIDTLEVQVMDISERQQKIEAVAEEREAVACRVRILRFSDELRRGIRHSQESFGQVIADIDHYELFCRDRPDFQNNRTIVAKGRIIAAYDKCLEDNDFL